MIRSLLFDMGNVLVHFSHQTMCRQMGVLCGRSAAEIRALLFDGGLQREFESGRVTEEDFHHQFEQAVGQPVDIDRLREAGSDIFTLNEPMLPVLDALKRYGHRLVLLSNTSVAHFDWVRDRFDVLERFDDFVVSYQVGAVKPERAIYEAALQQIACDPAEAFYTDDIAKYVERGHSFGLQAEVFTDAAGLVEQLCARGIDLGGAV